MFGPNITGYTTSKALFDGAIGHGAFTTRDGGTFAGGGRNYTAKNLYFYADDSSSFYGNSSTVQPASMQALVLIKF